MLLSAVEAMRGAYSAAYRVSFIDNAEARDLNASIVAGLAAAMTSDPRDAPATEAWEEVRSEMIATDPWGYGEVPWVERSVARWIRFSEDAAERADHEPSRLRRILEGELGAETWWEAHTTFSMAWSAMVFCDFDPMASMRLAIEMGHDTDSTAQIVGMFMGAMHGPGAFPGEMRDLVSARLEAEYGESVEKWIQTIDAARGRVR